MRVSDLKRILSEIPEEIGDVEVYVVADHGQDLESAFSATIEKAYQDGGEMFEVHPDDVDDYDSEDLQTIFVIAG